MAFTQRLERAAAQVDARLAEALASADYPDRLAAAIRHAALGAGKRLRPFLVFESAALFELPAERALGAAAAIECVHCYSLAHDDLPAMDNDELRRGRPTVWKAYDEWTAILAGDALLTLAFELLADPATHPDAIVRCELASTLARASGAAGMVGGQALDLEAGKLNEPREMTAAHIARLQAMKTGALITCACEMGAVLAQAAPRERLALRTFGEALGQAFQIADDLLDAEGDAATTGKAVAKDSAAGKATLVALYGIPATRKHLCNLAQSAVTALAPFGARAATLVEAAAFVSSRKS